jgi:tyrosyl-tRNA synthetase
MTVDLVQAPILEDLSARGLIHQSTAPELLSEHLRTPRLVYGGFDPTRDSLTIGNLVTLLLLKRFQLHGHKPIVLMGGGTGLIGDPSGKDSERSLLSREEIEANVRGQRRIFETVLDFDGPSGAEIVNNADWLGKLSYLEVLRDIGKHFSVNMMIQKDSVRTRLEGRDHGISYTEFSYMILQSYDYAYLAKERGITLQVGGSDQWGNITLGVELARRLHQLEVFGLTTPLLTKSDGGKFGKTESGAVWLTRERTSPYAFYQFWMNAADADVERFLNVFSLRPVAELRQIVAEHAARPEARTAQRALAEELTRLLHGEEGLKEAEAATAALFSGDIRSLDERVLEEAFAGAPSYELSRESLGGEGLELAQLLVDAGAAKSKREARQFLEASAVLLNGEKCDLARRVTEADLLFGRLLLIRRGKKNWHVGRVRP